jgi:hypothetical protein
MPEHEQLQITGGLDDRRASQQSLRHPRRAWSANEVGMAIVFLA